MPELVCFPGWSAQRLLSQWQSRSATTISHLTQWEVLSRKKDVPAQWFPEEPWVMVTWSMGTWTGLYCSQHWGDRAPQAWIALSPFVNLVGDVDCKIERSALELLLKAYREQPEKTLQLFCKQQGGRFPWSEGEHAENFYERLGDSLEALLEGPPVLPESLLKVPTWAILGERDRLVNRSMAEGFCSLVEHSKLLICDKGHDLFYGEHSLWPEDL